MNIESGKFTIRVIKCNADEVYKHPEELPTDEAQLKAASEISQFCPGECYRYFGAQRCQIQKYDRFYVAQKIETLNFKQLLYTTYMTNLTNRHCVPCEGGVDPFNAEQIKTYIGLLNLPWETVDGKKLKHEFKFKDFKEALSFVNKVADIAESEGHHPDLHIYYNKVKIVLWTHAIDGLSENDFILAAKIEKLLG